MAIFRREKRDASPGTTFAYGIKTRIRGTSERGASAKTKPTSARSNPSKLDTGFDNATRRVKSQWILPATGGSGPDSRSRGAREGSSLLGREGSARFPNPRLRTLGGMRRKRRRCEKALTGSRAVSFLRNLLILFRYR